MVRVIWIQMPTSMLDSHRFQLVVLHLDRTRDKFASQVRAYRRDGARLRHLATLVGNLIERRLTAQFTAWITLESFAPVFVFASADPVRLHVTVPTLYEAARDRSHLAAWPLLATIMLVNFYVWLNNPAERLSVLLFGER